jgi:methionine synthase I (cobalamin-dependent)/5,10-methylenetetrahydrofolate reductase
MGKVTFLERLQTGAPVLGDGAMGTMLHQYGGSITMCFDELNRLHPEQVADVHRVYIEAGSELIETNTFGANRYKLAKHGLENDVVAINKAGADLARSVVRNIGRDDVYVAGSVGPLGVRLKPFGRVRPEDARAAFAEQIRALTDAGVDAILLETFSDRMELLEALAAAKETAPRIPVICHMTFGGDDRTLLGDLPGQVARDLQKAGADVIGANCGGGPEQLSRTLQLMRQAVPDHLLSAMPNAGFPSSVGGRVMYPATEEYFAEAALTFKAIGVSIIGGCCGTTPEHIASMRAALDNPALPLPHIEFPEANGDDQTLVPERATELARKLGANKFVVTVEMKPPRSFVPQKLLASARLLQEAGADLVNVADSPTAKMRMSPWAVCHFLQTQQEMETILHFPTRGRNLLRVQGDLLAAHALGLRNLFVVMGDPTKIGDYPEAMDNYDVAPSALIGIIKHKMNHGVDQAGNSIGQPTTFTVGCALNMFADDLDREIATLQKKLENGADFALGQAVFEPSRIEVFHKRYEQIVGEPLKLPILMGLMPLYNLNHAQFLHNEIPGVSIPSTIMKRIEDAGDKAAEEGVRIAQELLRDIHGLVQGAYIIPAFGHYELVADVIDSMAVPTSR